MSEYVVELTDANHNRLMAECDGIHELIVRCRDCVGFEEAWDGWECQRFSGEYHRAHPDGFCYWGERRDG